MGFFPTIHLLFRVLFLGAVSHILIQGNAAQIPLLTNEYTSHWNFFDKPSQDSTSHLIFDTVHSFLQHWPNTRYRNGHSIVPGTIPIGTLLYHAAPINQIPRTPEWTATDPEHSYVFCFGGPQDPGCWQLTLVTTRPLKVLYFDGNSAAKMVGGSMDSQDILIWGEVKPDWVFEEIQRINDLCDWGKQYGIDGFVRMEMDFEVMLCDFTAGVQVLSFHHLVAREHGPIRRRKPVDNFFNISEPINEPTGYRVIEAGSWHNHFPGETRIHLHYAGMISFYDTALFPSLQTLRSKKERWDHRLEGMHSEDVQTLSKTLQSLLLVGDGAWDRPMSGIDWKTLLRVVVDRYVDRLQDLNRLLDIDSKANATLALKRAHNLISGMLTPYRLYSASPPEIIHSMPKYSWAIPVFKECATTHTRYIDTLSKNLTYSEHLLLDSTKAVSKEICRVIVGMWAEGMDHTASKEEKAFTGSEVQEWVIRWKRAVQELMTWLDWSEWVTCRPACGDEELCYLPTWPFFNRGPRGPPPPPPRYSRSIYHFEWRSKSDGDDDEWIKPQPRCIRKIE